MATFEHFKETVVELVARFEADAGHMRSGRYDEATLRLEYLDPFFAALGWNVWNKPPQPMHMRDVVVENRLDRRGSAGRTDYVFRTGGLDRWVCEAKRPFDNIERHYYQIQNYTYNMRLWLGALCSFEYLIIFIVGGAPVKDRPFSPVNGWRLHYTDYVLFAQKIWDLLSKEAVESGAIEQFIQALPKSPTRARQGWLIKPDRTKGVDVKFLEFLEHHRRLFAKDIVKSNPTISWHSGEVAERLQEIFDRILFQRVSEDRNIDVGTPLAKTLASWEGRGKLKGQLWPMIAANFRHLSATFNGGVYGKDPRKPPKADDLNISDALLADFVEGIAGDESEWLFNAMPLWVLGSVYERFLGSEIDKNGDVEWKLSARKAGGVYYTPESVVKQVVEMCLGPLIRGRSPEDILKVKVIDPSCGSGTFLLSAYDQMLHECELWFELHPELISAADCFKIEGKLYLTTSFKRKILRSCIFGVDIDPVAVQVARMSLCLRVLEGENQEALGKELTLFPKQTFLPDLDSNVINANSLLPTSAYPTHITLDQFESSNAIDWRELLNQTARGKGFDVVVGNPPWGATLEPHVAAYARIAHRQSIVRMPDTYLYFTDLVLTDLLKPEEFLVWFCLELCSIKLTRPHYEKYFSPTIFRQSRTWGRRFLVMRSTLRA